MHILLIHQAFTSLDEAGGTRHMEMARLLADQGYQITIIASPISYLTGKTKYPPPELSGKSNQYPGIRILHTYTFPAIHKSFFHRILSFFSFMVSSFLAGVKVNKVDLVWGTSPPIFQGVTCWLLAKLKGVPFLFEVRDLWPAFAIAIGVIKNPLLIRMSEWLEKFLYLHADLVIVNSPGYLDHVSQTGATNIKLIPNGADLDLFSDSINGDDFRKKCHWENQYVVMYAGAHGLSNDLDVILQAANILRNEKEIIFALVGDGKEKENLIHKAEELHLEQVIFLPPVPKLEMASVLAASDACIAILKPLELYKTTFPNKVFDYMACSRPVILAIDGVIRQIVEDAQAGFPVTPGNPQELADAILYLFSHQEEGKIMGISGRSYVNKFYNRKTITDQFIRLLENLTKLC